MEADAEPMRRCEEKRKEWAKHWQCYSEVHGVEDNLWRNEKVRSWEEELPQLKEESLARAARIHKPTTGMDRDGFHPKVPWTCRKEREERR